MFNMALNHSKSSKSKFNYSQDCGGEILRREDSSHLGDNVSPVFQRSFSHAGFSLTPSLRNDANREQELKRVSQEGLSSLTTPFQERDSPACPGVPIKIKKVVTQTKKHSCRQLELNHEELFKLSPTPENASFEGFSIQSHCSSCTSGNLSSINSPQLSVIHSISRTIESSDSDCASEQDFPFTQVAGNEESVPVEDEDSTLSETADFKTSLKQDLETSNSLSDSSVSPPELNDFSGDSSSPEPPPDICVKSAPIGIPHPHPRFSDTSACLWTPLSGVSPIRRSCSHFGRLGRHCKRKFHGAGTTEDVRSVNGEGRRNGRFTSTPIDSSIKLDGIEISSIGDEEWSNLPLLKQNYVVDTSSELQTMSTLSQSLEESDNPVYLSGSDKENVDPIKKNRKSCVLTLKETPLPMFSSQPIPRNSVHRELERRCCSQPSSSVQISDVYSPLKKFKIMTGLDEEISE